MSQISERAPLATAPSRNQYQSQDNYGYENTGCQAQALNVQPQRANPSHSPEETRRLRREVRARHRQIAEDKGYAKSERRFDVRDVVISEAMKLFQDRHNGYYPEPGEQASADLYFLARVLRPGTYEGWIKWHTPWFNPAEAITEASQLPAASAEEISSHFGLTWAKKLKFEIHQLQPANVSPEELAALKRKRRTELAYERRAGQRKARGAKSHANSVEKQKPWEAKGVSRRTHYRQEKKRKEAERGTESVALPMIIYATQSAPSLARYIQGVLLQRIAAMASARAAQAASPQTASARPSGRRANLNR